MKITINYLYKVGIQHEDKDRLVIFDRNNGKGISIEKKILKQILEKELVE